MCFIHRGRNIYSTREIKQYALTDPNSKYSTWDFSVKKKQQTHKYKTLKKNKIKRENTKQNTKPKAKQNRQN